MLTGLLAALASTIDTHLTWGASYWSNDLYLRILNRPLLRREPSARELVRVARMSNVVILGIALLIMANLGSIQTAWYVTLLFGAGTGAVLVRGRAADRKRECAVFIGLHPGRETVGVSRTATTQSWSGFARWFGRATA